MGYFDFISFIKSIPLPSGNFTSQRITSGSSLATVLEACLSVEASITEKPSSLISRANKLLNFSSSSMIRTLFNYTVVLYKVKKSTFNFLFSVAGNADVIKAKDKMKSFIKTQNLWGMPLFFFKHFINGCYKQEYYCTCQQDHANNMYYSGWKHDCNFWFSNSYKKVGL